MSSITHDRACANALHEYVPTVKASVVMRRSSLPCAHSQCLSASPCAATSVAQHRRQQQRDRAPTLQVAHAINNAAVASGVPAQQVLACGRRTDLNR
eukprot:14342787-Alexandrium_andersonii.AAC.1